METTNVKPTDSLINECFSLAGKTAIVTGASRGLGLAIAQEIVGYHKGRIEVASSGVAGDGTTFTVSLPVSEKA